MAAEMEADAPGMATEAPGMAEIIETTEQMKATITTTTQMESAEEEPAEEKAT